MSNIIVKKADGTEEQFSEKKLRQSLKRSGANEENIQKVIKEISKKYSNKTTTTSKIYKDAFKILAKLEKPHVAARYSLKRAVLDLGPSGFPFEYFLAAIYTALGYKTETGVVMKGGCATHEVDVVAENSDEVKTIEAKFHNKLGLKTDLKVLLYVNSRYEDLLKSDFEGLLRDSGESGKKGIGMVATNTKFTRNAIRYSECVGMELLSWSYPKDKNLHDLVEDTGLHPITCLTSLPHGKKKALLDKGLVLCRMIREDQKVLSELGISKKKISGIMEEINELCVKGSGF